MFLFWRSSMKRAFANYRKGCTNRGVASTQKKKEQPRCSFCRRLRLRYFFGVDSAMALPAFEPVFNALPFTCEFTCSAFCR